MALARSPTHLAINGIAEGVHDTAQQPLPHRHVHNVARATHQIALLDQTIIAKDDNAHIVRLQVERHALHASMEQRRRDAAIPTCTPLEKTTISSACTFCSP